MKRPRILRILNRLNVGGPVFSAAYLARELAPEFETLLVAGPPTEGEASAAAICEQLGIEPLLMPTMQRSIHPLRDPKAVWAMRQLIRRYRPTIVHTHAAKAGLVGRVAATLERVPCRVHTFEGHVFHSYFGQVKTRAFLEIERGLARYSHRLIAISESQQTDLIDVFRIAQAERFRVVRNGYDLSRFTEGQHSLRIQFRKEYGLTEDVVAVGIVGRLTGIKNHRLFVDAFDLLRRNSPSHVVGFFVGDGELRLELEAQARALNIPFTTGRGKAIPGGLVFMSWVSDTERVYAGVDCIALSSKNEGNPVTLIEAQAAARPVVATDVGGVRDTMLDGKSGLLVAPDNVSVFAKALLTVVSNPQVRIDMGHKGRDFVLQNHGLPAFVSSMARVYDELMSLSGKRTGFM